MMLMLDVLKVNFKICMIIVLRIYFDWGAQEVTPGKKIVSKGWWWDLGKAKCQHIIKV
jgi:hypothetical protein